jgi:hypothetical protein
MRSGDIVGSGGELDEHDDALYAALNDLAASIGAADLLRSSWDQLGEPERRELLDMMLRRSRAAATALQDELARAHPTGVRIDFH